MKTKMIVVAMLFCIIIAGCKQNSTARTSTDNDIKFDTIVINEKYYLLGDTTNPYCTLEASLLFPSEDKDKEILAHFIYSLFGEEATFTTPEEVVNEYVQKYIADYKELEADFISEVETTGEKPSQESWFAYYEALSNDVVYNKNKLLSYTVSVEYYTGGAHGGQGHNNHVIDLETNYKLDEDDIFVENYHDELSKIIVDAIASDNSISNPSELENMGFFNIKEIYPNNNFYIDKDGITYTFNEYEIAAKFVGKVDVSIPYERISYLIREDSPIAPLVFTKK